MRELEAYIWLAILVLMPFIAWGWHKFTTSEVFSRFIGLDNPAHETSLRHNGAAAADAESDSRCNTFTK